MDMMKIVNFTNDCPYILLFLIILFTRNKYKTGNTARRACFSLSPSICTYNSTLPYQYFKFLFVLLLLSI